MNENDIGMAEVWSANPALESELLRQLGVAVPPGIDPLGPVTAQELEQGRHAQRDREALLEAQAAMVALSDKPTGVQQEMLAIATALTPLITYLCERAAAAGREAAQAVYDGASVMAMVNDDFEQQVKEWARDEAEDVVRDHERSYDHEHYDQYDTRLDDLERGDDNRIDEKISDAVDEALADKDYVEKDDVESLIDDWADEHFGEKLYDAMSGSTMTVQIRRFE